MPKTLIPLREERKVDIGKQFKSGLSKNECDSLIIDRICYIRRLVNLSKVELSCLLEKNDNYISNLESGYYSINLSVLINFLNLFRIPLNMFFSNKFFETINKEKNIEDLKRVTNSLVKKNWEELKDRKNIRVKAQEQYRQKIKETW